MSLRTKKKEPRIPKNLPVPGHIDKSAILSSFSPQKSLQTEPKKPSMATLLKKWAKDVKERDGHRCQKCGQTGTDAHHLYPRVARYSHLKLVLANGVTLCRECHRKAHKAMKAYRKWWAGLNEAFRAVYEAQGEVK